MSTRTRNFFWFIFGFFVGTINAFRHRLFGYSRPRPFSPKKVLETIAYNKRVVHSWEQQLMSFQGSDGSFSGKDVVEVGPGYDYGAGAVLVSLGAASYKAIDRFSLSCGDRKYYEALLETLRADMIMKGLDMTRLSEVIRGVIAQGSLYSNPIFSVVQSSVEDASLGMNGTADIIVSQAVLEHVQDINKSFRSMYQILRENGVMCHEIDFQTHTQILRERDPLNIFRYSRSQWETWFTFPGCPNRFRPNDFVRAAQRAGFKDVSLLPICSLSDGVVQDVKQHLAEPFRNESVSTLPILSAVLLARKL